MGYEPALDKAWSELKSLSKESSLSVKFLSDEYSIDVNKREILSLACNIKAKDFYSILILHYLIQELKGIPRLTSEWASFQEFDGGQGYYPAFRKRVIEPIIRKYGSNPKSLLESVEKFSAKAVQFGDSGIVIEAFKGIPILITLWAGDSEFGPEANMLFDKSITKIFPTEDIVVLGGIVASLV
ncbi:MAG: DUF3786 domain-containing protein [Candidatus Omnitrophica bacterium]|nr:DUF3786 domain-containing protein [Candidatus Omnitrophota bacterium]HOX53991.1 DUF3786 domain-containing protein [Candidatus Omnitrophota bacterium]